MGSKPLGGVWRTPSGVILALGLTIGWSMIPARAAGGWWVRAPSSTPPISAVASDQGAVTLAISKGQPGWYSPTSGEFTSIISPLQPAASLGIAVAVAAAGQRGVVAYQHGLIAEVSRGGLSRRVGVVQGVPRAVAVTAGQGVAVVTSQGLFTGLPGARLTLVAAGDGQALIAPPAGGLPWLALLSGWLWRRAAGQGWVRAAGSPNFGLETEAIAQLDSGVILVGQPGGLIWRREQGSWSRALQVLPYGGLGGVPGVTSLVAVGSSSAYLGTDGFGTLLTPDGGYTWYRAPPSQAAITGLATVGPVFVRQAHGFVVGLSSGAVFLHRLQAFPEPPSYTPTVNAAELGGTAAVTLGAALLVTLLLWLLVLRERRLSV
ncbi:MAG TPA: hypothetical protein VMV12_07715 [Candidatus Micrarchaeaceae archaeon]|nr:hypothetical protein [Candidatus Micrarchaeaceae archaeon]